MKNTVQTRHAVALAGLLLVVGGPTLRAAEVDFSCMSHSVLGKIQVSERYKEYDVGLSNSCPGPVYWAMCIERIDPLSHKLVEVHTPTGYLEAERNSRVNLQLKKGPDPMSFRKRFQEFYVNMAYGIDTTPAPHCVASGCEAQRGDLRARIDANLQAWEQAEKALSEQLARDCPASGWDKSEQLESCEAAVREVAREELDRLARTDTELRTQLQEGGPPQCRIYAGDLVK